MKDQYSLDKLPIPEPISKEEYKEKIVKLQERASRVVYYANKVDRPIVLVFEGWDAAGKGGAIRRLTYKVDPRLYRVHSIAAPNSAEANRHYLWRFWSRLPERGRLGIFDRSWYGRVLVERVEGFCSEEEWRRAFREIREFEKEILSYDGIVMKFWLHITAEEQLQRFEARQADPLKRWKLTEEDWRNRDKMDVYKQAANEAFIETSSPNSPWILVQANSKYNARLSVIENFVEYCEKDLKIPKKFQ